MSERKCGKCTRFKRQGKSHWGNCPVAECWGETDRGDDETACPAFDDGKLENAVWGLCYRVSVLIDSTEGDTMPSFTKIFREMLTKALAAVEAARKARGK